MTEPFYPLNRPLPPDVAAGDAALIRFYQKYQVFSWPWAWRRTVVFGSVGMLAGLLFGASHGLSVKVAWEALAVGFTCGMANVILVGAGPALAAAVRQARWPRGAERVLIVTAILVGMILATLAANLASRFHDQLMATHGKHNMKAAVTAPAPDFHSLMNRVIDSSIDLFILFIANGGLALATYFAEPKRWAEHRRRAELEKASAQKSASDLRLTILQAQVEPHFLFNTLASVRSLVSTDPGRATQTIDALAQYLRATLPKFRAEAGLASSTLGEQFDICVSYLELMKVRLGERLRVNIQLPPDLHNAPFPPLLLISLVENAITHGVELKPGVTQVTLVARIVAANDARQLEVRVEDDGAGLELGMGEGTGLANVRAQLRTLFADAAVFELSERSGGGVVARMVLPFRS
ncbi:MAG: histidine kinase [Pseudomonadota bacterium]